MNLEIEEEIQNLSQQKHFSKSIAIRQFLNPHEEKLDKDLEIFVHKIVKVYSMGDRTYETDEGDVIIPKVGYFE